MNEQLLYHIAITSIPNIGDVTAKKLIAYCGISEQVFNEKKSTLEKIPGIAAIISKQEKIGIDELSLQAKLPMSKTTATLLEMEFNGVVKALPGKLYKLV
jgi:predicted Rossmann fold nucleotide-binding protein DprA/Smf involved in DNA uptake